MEVVNTYFNNAVPQKYFPLIDDNYYTTRLQYEELLYGLIYDIRKRYDSWNTKTTRAANALFQVAYPKFNYPALGVSYYSYKFLQKIKNFPSKIDLKLPLKSFDGYSLLGIHKNDLLPFLEIKEFSQEKIKRFQIVENLDLINEFKVSGIADDATARKDQVTDLKVGEDEQNKNFLLNQPHDKTFVEFITKKQQKYDFEYLSQLNFGNASGFQWEHLGNNTIINLLEGEAILVKITGPEYFNRYFYLFGQE